MQNFSKLRVVEGVPEVEEEYVIFIEFGVK